jgi:RimJ/RimL family protein N-acetyltransferase
VVVLRPINPGDYEALRLAELDASAEGRWRLAGTTPSPEQYPQTLWADVLAQFLVALSPSNEVVGMVSAYGYQPADGVVSLAAVNFLQPRQRAVFMRGAAMFIDWLFAMHPLRRIRIETPEWNLEHLGGLVDHGFASIEGRLVKERFVNGAYVDVVLMAITRERWDERRHLVVPR